MSMGTQRRMAASAHRPGEQLMLADKMAPAFAGA
jgi:hypothetical protein